MKFIISLLIIQFTFFSPELSANESSEAAGTEATVVFMRSSMVGKFIKASVYEITDDETIFIGILKNKKRLEYKTTAGKHRFMVISEAADFMEANVAAGKTYHSIVTPRMGAWKARFSLWPIRKGAAGEHQWDSKDIQKRFKKTKLITKSEKDDIWYNKNKDSVEKKKQKYLPKWETNAEADIAARTLNPEDGQ